MARPFAINGIQIPTPTTCKFGIEELSSEGTGRTLDGVMHKDVIAVKDYYECTWASLTWAEAALILTALNGQQQVTFTHADPRTPGQYVTGNYYVGKRSGDALDLSDPTNAWSDLALTFTQI